MNLIVIIKKKKHALRRPYRTYARARVMDEIEKVQEQMKAENQQKVLERENVKIEDKNWEKVETKFIFLISPMENFFYK